MGGLVVRGKAGALIRLGESLLTFSNDQYQMINIKSNINTSAHIAGALIAQAEMISSSLRNIEKVMIQEEGKLGGSKINVKELRKMIEEYGNLDKIGR